MTIDFSKAVTWGTAERSDERQMTPTGVEPVLHA